MVRGTKARGGAGGEKLDAREKSIVIEQTLRGIWLRMKGTAIDGRRDFGEDLRRAQGRAMYEE